MVVVRVGLLKIRPISHTTPRAKCFVVEHTERSAGGTPPYRVPLREPQASPHRSTLLKVTRAIGAVGLGRAMTESGSNIGCGLTLLLLHSSSTSCRVSAAADTVMQRAGRGI